MQLNKAENLISTETDRRLFCIGAEGIADSQASKVRMHELLVEIAGGGIDLNPQPSHVRRRSCADPLVTNHAVANIGGDADIAALER